MVLNSGHHAIPRTLAEPQPFTAARNVDAMRARYETDERVTVNTRVAWARTPVSGNVSVLYVGPDSEEATAATMAFIRGVHASRVSASVLWSLGGLCLVAGVAAGMRASRRDGLTRA